MKKIDLHTHSDQSDGTLSPEELITLADSEGLDCIALCDHDTTEGIGRFKKAASGKAFQVIGGIELSVSWSAGTCHILGLDVDVDNAELQLMLKSFRERRDSRNITIISKLNELGIAIDIATIQKSCHGKVIGRPHIAKELVKIGAASSYQDAFEQFLKRGAKAYVPRYLIEPVAAISALKNAAGITVLAHPVQLNVAGEQLMTIVKQLKDYGLDAIEVYTPHHNDQHIHEYSRLAHSLGLGISGGSDFHGHYRPDRHLGMYGDGKQIPWSVGELL